MAGERGESRAIYTVIADDPDFLELSPEAKCMWYTLKMKLGASGIDVVGLATLSEATGIPYERVSEPLNELVDGGWAIVERNVIWLRNALHFDPYISLSHDRHRSSVQKHLRSLPKLGIVNAFADYYGLEPPFPSVPFSRVARPTAEPFLLPDSEGSGEGQPAFTKGSADRMQDAGSRREDAGIRRDADVPLPVGRSTSGADSPDSFPQPDRAVSAEIGRRLMPIVRGANGRPGLYGGSRSPGHGRTEDQDVDTLTRFHVKHGRSLDELEAMILGAVMMREDGQLDFAKPGESLTTGAFYIQGTGPRPFAAQAIDYFHKHAGDERWQGLVRWRKDNDE